ncbi:phosphoribosyltransferase family protein [Streptococcus dentapri]|uniref:ComF family protein n=1 Tax=Streptococcus dentapri TaxID=573564 RepID=A0ABV8D0Y5_9STRE
MLCLICSKSVSSQNHFTSLILTHRKQDTICPECWSQFERIESPHCPHCCKAGISEICQDCQYWQNKGNLVDHQALFTYNQAMKNYFSSYKFQGDYLLRKIFSSLIKNELKKYKDYTIVPIPLSDTSYHKRRFNQVIGFLDDGEIAYRNLLLVNKKDKAAQSSKRKEERLKTKQFLKVRDQQKLPSKILLVDDIYTTGATLALARELLDEKGVKTIKTFSLAR